MQPHDQHNSHAPQNGAADNLSQTPPPAQPAPQQPAFQQPAPGAPVAYPAAYAPAPQGNPGSGLGIASIILGVLGITIVGLPLGIVSIVKSNKVRASKTLGVIGTVINSVVLIATLIILPMIVLAGYSGVQQRAKQAQEKVVAQKQAAATVSINDAYTVTGGNAYWAFPTAPIGWKMTVFDKDGQNAMESLDGSRKFVSFQGVDTLKGTTDAAKTADAIDVYLTAMNATKIGSPTTMTFTQLSDSKAVEFVVQAYSFKGGNKGIIAVRAFGTGNVLFADYKGTPTAYSEADWQQLTSKLKINDGVY